MVLLILEKFFPITKKFDKELALNFHYIKYELQPLELNRIRIKHRDRKSWNGNKSDLLRDSRKKSYRVSLCEFADKAATVSKHKKLEIARESFMRQRGENFFLSGKSVEFSMLSQYTIHFPPKLNPLDGRCPEMCRRWRLLSYICC